MTDKPFATVTWEVSLYKDYLGLGIHDSKIVESTLDPKTEQRYYDLIYGDAYSAGNHYLEDFLNNDLPQIENFPKEGTPYLVTMGLFKDWDQPGGTPDIPIKVEEGADDTKTLIWPREEPTASEPTEAPK